MSFREAAGIPIPVIAAFDGYGIGRLLTRRQCDTPLPPWERLKGVPDDVDQDLPRLAKFPSTGGRASSYAFTISTGRFLY